jgi:hypothetical protein
MTEFGRPWVRRAVWITVLAAGAAALMLPDGPRASGTARQSVRMEVIAASSFGFPAGGSTLGMILPHTQSVHGRPRAEVCVRPGYTIVESADTKTILTASYGEDNQAPSGYGLRLELDGAASSPEVEGEAITVSEVARRVLTFSGSSFAAIGEPGAPRLRYGLEATGPAAAGAGTRPAVAQHVTITLTLTEAS